MCIMHSTVHERARHEGLITTPSICAGIMAMHYHSHTMRGEMAAPALVNCILFQQHARPGAACESTPSSMRRQTACSSLPRAQSCVLCRKHALQACARLHQHIACTPGSRQLQQPVITEWPAAAPAWAMCATCSPAHRAMQLLPLRCTLRPCQ